MSCYNKTTLCSFFFLFPLFVDRITKIGAFHWLRSMPSQEIGSLFGVDLFLSFTTNSGAAWGILSSSPTILLGIRALLILLILRMLFSSTVRPIAAAGLSLILAGAVSNLIDIPIYGAVIDMIHVRLWGYDYPIFNMADSSITVGACLFFFDSLRS